MQKTITNQNVKSLKNINIRFVLDELEYILTKEKVKVDTYEDPLTGRKIMIPKIKQLFTMNEAKAVLSNGSNQVSETELEILRKHSLLKVKTCISNYNYPFEKETFPFPRRIS